jgi:hypothetical protein
MQTKNLKQKLLEAEPIFIDILKATGGWKRNCGSYLMHPRSYTYNWGMYHKQNLLYRYAQRATSVLEVGTYLGHSLLIMLLANPKMRVTTIDAFDAYAKPAVAVLQDAFPDSKLTFVEGESPDILSSVTGYFDLFHLDGMHQNDVVIKEIKDCQRFVEPRRSMKIVLDDIFLMPRAKRHITNNYKICHQELSVPDPQKGNWFAELILPEIR